MLPSPVMIQRPIELHFTVATNNVGRRSYHQEQSYYGVEVVAKIRQSLLFSLPSFPISQSHSQALGTWTGNEATYAHTDQLTYHNDLPSMGCLVRICTGPSPGSGAYQHYVLQPLVVHVGWTNEDLCVQLAGSVAIVEHLIAPEVVAIFVEEL